MIVTGHITTRFSLCEDYLCGWRIRFFGGGGTVGDDGDSSAADYRVSSGDAAGDNITPSSSTTRCYHVRLWIPVMVV